MKKRLPSKRYHLILDAVEVNKEYLTNKDFLKGFLKEITSIIKMEILHGPVIIEGNKKNPGLTAFCIIDYSHISIHTFTKEKEFCFDVFSCKLFDYAKVEDYLIRKLNIGPDKIFKSKPKYNRC